MTTPQKDNRLHPEAIIAHFESARERRGVWAAHWRDCYDYALPQRDGVVGEETAGARKVDRLFDGTAPDAVEQLAASLLSELTPPWAQWFGFGPGVDMSAADRALLTPELDRAATVMKAHFDKSNFSVEVHQCYLDLVTAGTASLMFEETEVGSASAFRFSSEPLKNVVVEEGPAGRLDVTYRRGRLTLEAFARRFPAAPIPEALNKRAKDDPDFKLSVIEAVIPDGITYRYGAVLENDEGKGAPTLIAEGRFQTSPFINFRWLKAPGEAYGRSPVMKALPDIKTANKVVELVLKNASIAVTGIWQADDDGVLNPATIKLRPGTIIPKAVGSSGLTPLETPGQFDVSDLVLEKLQARIRSALMVDRLAPSQGAAMTATEVIERTDAMARVLGATYGRLQSELLTPLIMRALSILTRRGEIPPIRIDGRVIELEYRSPLALYQARRDARSALLWLETVRGLGPDAMTAVDGPAAARWLARTFSVPAEMVRAADPIPETQTQISLQTDGETS